MTSHLLSLHAVLVLCVCSRSDAIKTGDVCKASSKCTILPGCAPFMDLLHLQEKPLKPSVVDFLRSQQCGFQDGFPKVCCASLPKTIPILTHDPKKASIDVTPPPPSQQKEVDLDKAMERLFDDLSAFDVLRKTRDSLYNSDVEIR